MIEVNAAEVEREVKKKITKPAENHLLYDIESPKFRRDLKVKVLLLMQKIIDENDYGLTEYIKDCFGGLSPTKVMGHIVDQTDTGERILDQLSLDVGLDLWERVTE